ncbi:NAD(P)/FAD-dependent oxidoreductase [Myxococcota bacterium]|nr:NAD(P)/FAD-dependent oxidoreductase [Myxococcota bacterium]
MGSETDVDAVVIGAGFGGLGAALRLAEGGASVVLCEALAYPGGCASTFQRRGARYETGATLFSGLGEGQFLRQLRDRYAPELRLDFPDPVVELRAPGLTLPIPKDRDKLIDALCALPGAPQARLRAFFAEQGRVAAGLWDLFNDPALLPPWDLGGLARLATKAPGLLGLPRLMGRPLAAAVRRHGLEGFEPLRIYLDAVCQITVQTSSAEAEAPFAMAAMDYYFQGAGHVHGGIGQLAWALARGVESQGGRFYSACRAKSLRRESGRWAVEARGETFRAPLVITNLLPQDTRALLGAAPGAIPHLDSLAEAVAGGWSAAMLYLRVDPAVCPRPEAHHVELVMDPSRPFSHGNHLFCSVSAADEDRAEDGARTVTISTHVSMPELLAEADQGAKMRQVHEAMRQTLGSLAPELRAGQRDEMTASPRTWRRFTRRSEGLVGGAPRTAGLRHYTGFWPRAVAPGLYLVGDSVFPGQSALATALGGHKLGAYLLRGRPSPRASLMPRPADVPPRLAP